MASSPLLHSSENGLLLRLEGILTSYSALKDLKTASSDEELAVVLDKFREEMNEKSKILFALAGLHAAFLKVGSSPATDTGSAPCVIVLAIGTIATAAGIVPCAWWFVQYDWVDPATFKASIRDPNDKFITFSLSSRIPAFSVLVASWSFSIFLTLAAFEKHPSLVIGMLCVCVPLFTSRLWGYPMYVVAIWAKRAIGRGYNAVLGRLLTQLFL